MVRACSQRPKACLFWHFSIRLHCFVVARAVRVEFYRIEVHLITLLLFKSRGGCANRFYIPFGHSNLNGWGRYAFCTFKLLFICINKGALGVAKPLLFFNILIISLESVLRNNRLCSVLVRAAGTSNWGNTGRSG